MQLKLLALLPSVASQSAMIPLVHQVLLPMLHKDVNPYVICNCSLIYFHYIGHMIFVENGDETKIYSVKRRWGGGGGRC